MVSQHDKDHLKVTNLVNAFVVMYPNSEYGPAHIVLSDYNLDDESFSFALERLELARWDRRDYVYDLTDEEIGATEAFLWFLRTLPGDWREDFDNSDSEV